MAFDVGALTAYVEENRAELFMKAILGAKTLLPGSELVDLRPNIKGSEKVPYIETTAPFQANSDCGFNASGTTTINQTQISVSDIKVQGKLCPQTLEGYFTQKYLPPGSNYGTKDEAAINQEIISKIVDDLIRRIALQTEQAVWLSATAHTFNTNLKQFDGLLTKIDAASGTVYTTATAAITTSNVRTIFEENIFEDIPSEILDQSITVCGYDVLRKLQQKFLTDNFPAGAYQVPDNTFGKMALKYPGTEHMVIGVPGLNNDVDSRLPGTHKQRIVSYAKENLVIGTDLASDFSLFDIWWSKDNDELRYSCKFKLGAAVHFGDQIATYKNS